MEGYKIPITVAQHLKKLALVSKLSQANVIFLHPLMLISQKDLLLVWYSK